jgi:hypothetical protein
MNRARAKAVKLEMKAFIADSSLLQYLSEIDIWVSHVETPSETLSKRMRSCPDIFLPKCIIL